MNRPSDVDARLSAWLEEGPTSGPDEVLSKTFARARSTRQDRAYLYHLTHPTRFPRMYTTLKIAAIAAMALAIGMAVDPLRSRGPDVVGAPSPSPAPTVVTLPLVGSLEPGRYSIDAGPWTPSRLTFTVPAGWITQEGFVSKRPAIGAGPDTVAFSTWLVSHVYGDACLHAPLVEVGTTVDELATALTKQAGRVASPATDVEVGGFPGKRIDLTVPANLDLFSCLYGNLKFWPDPGPDESGGLCCVAPGTTDSVSIVDVDGKRLVIVARTSPTASAADVAELKEVVDSIQIDQPSPSSSPAG